MTLPEACVAKILSFTSPADTISSAVVSSVFRCAGDSDLVWENFLPSEYKRLIRQSNENLNFSSRKELFRRLCQSVLIDNGRKVFKLDIFSGKISYILSARDLSITWSDQPMYWSWSHRQDSRFKEAIELVTTDWLEIHGKTRTGLLSPNTQYRAYLIMKVNARAYGLDIVPAETSIKVGKAQASKTSTYLCCLDDKKEQMKRVFFGNREERMAEVVVASAGDGQRTEPKDRRDGWMEIELGEFETGKEDHDEEVVMSLMEVEGFQLKGGIVIEGIEVRPKP